MFATALMGHHPINSIPITASIPVWTRTFSSTTVLTNAPSIFSLFSTMSVVMSLASFSAVSRGSPAFSNDLLYMGCIRTGPCGT